MSLYGQGIKFAKSSVSSRVKKGKFKNRTFSRAFRKEIELQVIL